MIKRDILIFLSDVSNKEIAEYFTDNLKHLLDSDILGIDIPESAAQEFKEWLAGKLADPDTEVPIPEGSIVEPFEP